MFPAQPFYPLVCYPEVFFVFKVHSHCCSWPSSLLEEPRPRVFSGRHCQVINGCVGLGFYVPLLPPFSGSAKSCVPECVPPFEVFYKKNPRSPLGPTRACSPSTHNFLPALKRRLSALSFAFLCFPSGESLKDLNPALSQSPAFVSSGRCCSRDCFGAYRNSCL